jgi:hypothetical protein
MENSQKDKNSHLKMKNTLHTKTERNTVETISVVSQGTVMAQ